MDRTGHALIIEEIERTYRYGTLSGGRPTFAQVRRRAVMIVTVVVMVLTMVRLLTLQVQLSEHRDNISEMRNSLDRICEDNDYEYRRLTDIQDLNSIRDIAMNDLGMVYPKSDQIIEFSTEGSDYVRQAAPIDNSAAGHDVLRDISGAIRK